MLIRVIRVIRSLKLSTGYSNRFHCQSIPGRNNHHYCRLSLMLALVREKHIASAVAGAVSPRISVVLCILSFSLYVFVWLVSWLVEYIILRLQNFGLEPPR